MVQIKIYSLSNVDKIKDKLLCYRIRDYYNQVKNSDDNSASDDTIEEFEKNIENILFFTDETLKAYDNSKLLNVKCGCYKISDQTNEVILQNGGNYGKVFDEWIEKYDFNPGENFKMLMSELENNMNLVAGPIMCRSVSNEMKQYIGIILNKLNIQFEYDVSKDMYDADVSDDVRGLIYYYKLIDVLDNATDDGFLISAY